MCEVWKTIPGYDRYEASDQGRIRSVDRYDRMGRFRPGRIISVGKTPGGYRIVYLHNEDGRATKTVNHLVCSAFHGVPQTGWQSRHKDGSRDNNTADNLEWGTAVENYRDRERHGTLPTPKAACPGGHEYKGWNRIERDGHVSGCRACTRAAVEVWRLRRRGVFADKGELADKYYARHQNGVGTPNKHYQKRNNNA